MKQFIVLLAVIPLMLVFMLQFSMDQINRSRAGVFCDLVYSAKEEAKQEGYFSEEIKEKLKSSISEKLGVDSSDIEIVSDDSVQYRLGSDYSRGLIYYRISIPIGKLMAGERLFGIRPEENTYYYCIDSVTASEKLK